MKRLFITLFAALLPLLAVAQELATFHVGSLVADKNAPHMAVLPEKYMTSPEWYNLEQEIERFAVSRVFQDGEDVSGSGNWDNYIKEMEKLIDQYTRDGNKEAAEQLRKTLEETKKEMKALEATLAEARAQARQGGEGLDGGELLAKVMEHAIGGRLFYGAEIFMGRFAHVRTQSSEENENAWGLMDAKGEMLIPARYQGLWIRDWANENGKNILLAQRVISWDDDKWEMRFFWDDGTSATQQTFTGAGVIDQVELFKVRFPDGGWGLLNADGRVITQRKYKKLDWNVNNVIDPDQGNFVYGERDGVNYIISRTDGSEIGTFRFYYDSDDLPVHEVKYYPGKGPVGR